jgi:hypothetical protein
MRGGVWRFKKHALNEIVYSIKTHNETATPFAWDYAGERRRREHA